VSLCKASPRRVFAGNLIAGLAVTVSVLLLAGNVVRATSYLSVTFDELIAGADVIFVGEVTDVRPFPVSTRDGTIVKTRVVFRVSDPLVGSTSILEVFDFLGGEWGDIGMVVAEMPQFAIGDRRVVFARREQSINPIVGFTQGLLRVARDSDGMERVFTLDGTPLGQPEHIGLRSNVDAATPDAPMSLSALRDRISRAVAEARQ
jgi:hypothetical protein